MSRLIIISDDLGTRLEGWVNRLNSNTPSAVRLVASEALEALTAINNAENHGLQADALRSSLTTLTA